MLNHALELGILHGVPLGHYGKMCHLQYANNLTFISIGGLEDLRIFKLILYFFERILGLAVNFQKSCLYASKGGALPDPNGASTLSCACNLLLVTYLRVPIFGRSPHQQGWLCLTQSIKARLVSWKIEFISTGGRLTLTYFVLTVIPNYCMSIFELPKWVI